MGQVMCVKAGIESPDGRDQPVSPAKELERWQSEGDPGRLPVLSVEAVAPDKGNFNWRDHFHRMLALMREPPIDRKLHASRSVAERAANGRYTGCPQGDATGYKL